MGFFRLLLVFWRSLLFGTIGSIATGLLGQKGANDRNEQQIALTREQMEWQGACLILRISAKLRI